MTKIYSRQWSHKGCIIRARGSGYQAEINRHGKRTRHAEPTRAAVKTHIEQKLVDPGNHGLAALTLNDKQRLDTVVALTILPDGIALGSTAGFWLKHKATSKTLSELFDLYLAKRSDLRPASLRKIRGRSGPDRRWHHSRHVHHGAKPGGIAGRGHGRRRRGRRERRGRRRTPRHAGYCKVTRVRAAHQEERLSYRDACAREGVSYTGFMRWR